MEGLHEAAQCRACPVGFFCATGALVWAAAGFFLFRLARQWLNVSANEGDDAEAPLAGKAQEGDEMITA